MVRLHNGSTDCQVEARWDLRLSHYKMEAASEARYMHDVLRKMLKAPVFLDVRSRTESSERAHSA